MVEGDKWEMYIPSALAYGDNGRVPGCLVFTMEIIQILGSTRPSKKKEE
jgi:FKBP-type peptidyl-prolyl cis-trans isomerase FklB